MQIHISRSKENLYESATAWIAAEIKDAVKNNGRCTIALSGGSTPKNIYELLAQKPLSETIPWQQVYFFWGDERMVPYDDDQNNAKMAFGSLLDHIDVPAVNIHRMPSELDPAAAEKQYDELLHCFFPGTDTFSFDIILLGMGDDGHTLSLFPGTGVLNEKKKWVTAYYVEKQKQYRITLLPAIVNRCRTAAFIVSGVSKKEAFEAVISTEKNPERFPAQLIQPSIGELHWFVDAEVAENHP
ncbi:MAG: 6-phosphogluconolactonase [Ferruginibacter sp.]